MGTGRHASRRALVAAAAIAIGLAGCGSSSDDKPDAKKSAAAGLERKIDAAQAKSKAAPMNPTPLAELAKLHFQAATLKASSGEYGDDAKAQLREATRAWGRYLALDPQPVDTSVAKLMSAAYGPGLLDDPKRELAAQRVLVANTRPPDAAQFAQLAQKAYYAGEIQTGDAAAARAVELTPKSQRADMREILQRAKSQLTP